MFKKLAMVAASSNILKIIDFLKTIIWVKNRLFYVLPVLRKFT